MRQQFNLTTPFIFSSEKTSSQLMVFSIKCLIQCKQVEIQITLWKREKKENRQK